MSLNKIRFPCSTKYFQFIENWKIPTPLKIQPPMKNSFQFIENWKTLNIAFKYGIIDKNFQFIENWKGGITYWNSSHLSLLSIYRELKECIIKFKLDVELFIFQFIENWKEIFISIAFLYGSFKLSIYRELKVWGFTKLICLKVTVSFNL